VVVDASAQVLVNVAILTVLGLVLSFVSHKLRVSNALFLLLGGLVLGQFAGHFSWFSFSGTFLMVLAVLTLVMLVFASASRLQVKRIDSNMKFAFLLTMFSFLGLVLLLTMSVSLLFFGSFSAASVLFSLVLACIVSGTDPRAFFLPRKDKFGGFLEAESVVNTLLMLVFSFIFFAMLNDVQPNLALVPVLGGEFVFLMQQIVVGLGVGVLMSLIVLRGMKKFYHHRFSPIGLIAAALLSFILAETLQGSGVLSVMTLGLFFGNMYVKEKESLQEFHDVLSHSLVIFVFFLLGFLIRIDLTGAFILKTLVLFAILLLARYFGLYLSLRMQKRSWGKSFSLKEQLFIVLSMPKGMATAVLAFCFLVFALRSVFISPMHMILEILVCLMVYSLLLTVVVERMHKDKKSAL
jgi:NhaP-type Na+/H+ or K+/H+ antiporter